MPSISVILFYILAILGFCSAVGGLLSLSMFLIIIGIGLICAAFLLKKEFKIRPLAKVVIASSSDLPVQRLS
ncbi:hypothetical protein [Acinetobacter baumannii]|uniref:hypothetical protein n=3 Tax=Acinetobacter baumannii TaxID=470 RepID=UPI000B62E096|nr:hypothetical protein [Acinetobacter baumannii]OVK77533.1 hypothetical protein B4S08_07715 [Acinetobacter baumannii]OVO08191.1 hypothetical protein B9S45_18050 [Acinetobacter baumannii]